ncbi:type II secretion system F family protein [Novosphingobium bradum]|uniref:Type II secretion system F family protein n=1 Tax=Novosphingobium bradum TaxID=1737444 RepID=A0ABV7IR25_9SPHN
MTTFLASIGIARSAFLVAIFVAVVGSLVALWSGLAHRRALRSQLARVKGEGTIESSPSLREAAAHGAWARIAGTVEAAGLDLSDTRQERLTARLRSAGYYSAAAPQVFTLARLLLLFALPGGFLLLAWLTGHVPGFLGAYVAGTALALLGLYLPNLYVQARIDRRRDEITRGFPDCLDLLIVCVQSGLGIEASLDRVGREMAISHPLIAELLSVTTLQLRAGASREDAFRKLATLAQVEEIRSFTTLIIQSDKLGTSIVATLRVYAGEMREMRRLRAEEKAHRLPVLMSIPLVTCMLPVMVGVMMLPAAIRMIRQIIPAMLGG